MFSEKSLSDYIEKDAPGKVNNNNNNQCRHHQEHNTEDSTEDNTEHKTEGEKENIGAIRYMEMHGIKLAASQYEAVRDFFEQGITDEMLKFATDEAIEYGATAFAYVRKIVDDWICSDVRTLEDARTRREKRRKEQEEAKAARQRVQQAVQPYAQTSTPQAAPRFFSDRWGDS